MPRGKGMDTSAYSGVVDADDGDSATAAEAGLLVDSTTRSPIRTTWRKIAIICCVLVSIIGVVLAIVLVTRLPPDQPYWERSCSVFCKGPILAAVNLLAVFPDSKTFVDMPLDKLEPEAALQAFASVDSSSVSAVTAFIHANFLAAGTDVVTVTPPDWKSSPAVVSAQQNATLRGFASDINGIWKSLVRQVTESVITDPQKHTALPLPRPFVVAGGRFREIYFWDSFWITLGLLRSEMTDSATANAENLAWLALSFGKVPNGGRAYYVGRSQPPVLAMTVEAVVNATGNATLAKYALPAIDSELQWYYAEITGESLDVDHGVSVGGFFLHRYDVHVTSPRPESWREDEATAKGAGRAGTEAVELWSEIASAAESGWDFSSRWLGQTLEMASARTTKIVPADLNSLLVMELRAMARLQAQYGDAAAAAVHTARANELCGAINGLLWSPAHSWWADYDLEAGSLRPATDVTPAAWFPLWAGCAVPGANGSLPGMAAQAADALVTQSLLWQPGGVVTSLVSSQQQWDSPAAWPPLQWVMAEALQAAGRPAQSRELARRWLRSNLLGYTASGTMFEKYDAFVPGENAAGGEYTPQTGFGWTNGVALDFLSRWTWNDLE